MTGAQDMLSFPTDALDGAGSYKLVTAIVTPRPIAWLASLGPEGNCNLAPFSSYTFISYDPAKVLVSIGPGVEQLKDSLANIMAQGEFTVSAVTPDLLDPMVQTSANFPPETSEAAALGIAMQTSSHVRPPFVSGAPAAMECRLDRIIEVADADRHRLVIGTVVCFHVRPDVWAGDRIRIRSYAALGRIGGPLYQEAGEILHRPAPKN